MPVPGMGQRIAASAVAHASGGEGGIRTHGTRKGSTVFETARFNRSRTSPCTPKVPDLQAGSNSPPATRPSSLLLVNFVHPLFQILVVLLLQRRVLRRPINVA